jgi:outer membrane protein assembly factor BamE (lipoprotein component of BamABCDE complex)
MQTRILVALLCGCAAAGAAVAETIVVNDQVQVRETQVDRPKRGSTMGDVEKHFGAPVNRHATVGKPPITRWDYNGFAVFFEHDRVIHAVVTGG